MYDLLAMEGAQWKALPTISPASGTGLTRSAISSTRNAGGSTKKLAAVEAEFKAISAYEQAKSGRSASTSTGRGRTARRGSRREAILAMIRENPLSRGELLEKMGL